MYCTYNCRILVCKKAHKFWHLHWHFKHPYMQCAKLHVCRSNCTYLYTSYFDIKLHFTMFKMHKLPSYTTLYHGIAWSHVEMLVHTLLSSKPICIHLSHEVKFYPKIIFIQRIIITSQCMFWLKNIVIQ